MYTDLIKYPIRHEALTWGAREVLVDVDNRPQLFLRVKLTGTEFPMRALIPQVWVGRVYARTVVVDEDRRAVRAYFDKRPGRGRLYFGHLGRAELDFGPFSPGRVERLDPERLPPAVVDSAEPR